MGSTADIRNNVVLELNGGLWKVVEFLHVKPGKGPAFVRTKLKSLTTGKVLENTFPNGRKIDEVRVETHKYQFLYPEGDSFHFMNTEDYNQITLQKVILDAPELLKEGEIVTVIFNADDALPLSVEMPTSVVLEIIHTEPGIKGNTATNATKSATLETGASINVPLFINEGDKIKVDTEKGLYLERVKE